MIYLLLSILSSTSIAVIFKLIKGLNIKVFPIIVINYYAATIAGIFLNKKELTFIEIIHKEWVFVAIVIGVLLIVGFYLIGYTTQKIGIAITTVSNKISFVIPILFSIIYFSEDISWAKIIGIAIAIFAILLAVYKKREGSFNTKLIYLPISLFFVIGVIDSFIKLAQANFVPEHEIAVFTSLTFSIAAVIGTFLATFNKAFNKQTLNFRTLIIGIFLGLANFGSVYFIIFALNHSGIDSSILYGVNNIGIITMSVILAAFVFKEKLEIVNWFGIILSIISVIIFILL